MLSERNQVIMKHFPLDQPREEHYKTLIELGKKLPSFDKKYRTEKWLIKACQSPLWLKAEINDQGEIVFTGDSEGLIAKGILALFIQFYSGRKAEDILKDKPLFIEKLGLSEFLSSRRTNGLQALLEQIIQYSRAFLLLSQSPG